MTDGQTLVIRTNARYFTSMFTIAGTSAQYSQDECATRQAAMPSYNLSPLACSAGGGSGDPSRSEAAVGNPISASVGTKSQLEQDVQIGTDQFRFSRIYNSGIGTNLFSTILGKGWQHNFGATVSASTSNATVRRGDGRIQDFTLSGSTWTALPGVVDRLFPLTDGSGNLIGWRYLSADGSMDVFDSSGRLTSSTARDGKSYSLNYSDGTAVPPNGGVIQGTTTPLPAGILLSVTDSFGRVLSFGYDALNRIVGMSAPNGLTAAYAYDASGNLSTVTYSGAGGGTAGVRQYLYESTAFPNALTGIIDENGTRFATWSYDAYGRAVTSSHAGGADATSLTFGANNSTVVTDALSTSRTLSLQLASGVAHIAAQSQPAGAGCAAASKTVTYDANGNVASRTDFNGNVTCYASDLTRNLETSRLEGMASGGNCPASLTGYVPTAGTAQRLIQTQWHPTWRLKTREAAPLKVTTWVYNGQADPTNGGATLGCAPSTALLPDGSPIAVLCKKVEQATTDATGAAGFSATASGSARVWTYTYNQYGVVLTSTGPRGNLATTDPNYAAATTTYQYYAATDTAHTPPYYQMGDLQQVTDAVGRTSTYPQYDGNGRVLQKVDPNGTTTTFTYFPRGWLASRTVTPTGSSTSQVTSYVYDGVGQLKTVTNPDSSQINYTYDAAHRLTQVTDSAGDSINYTLDAMGNRTQELVKDPAGNLAGQVGRAYDALNRLQTITGALQ